MPTVVAALNIMIASPSGLSDAGQAVHTALIRWNEANTETRKVALIPRVCETRDIFAPRNSYNKRSKISQLLDQTDIFITFLDNQFIHATPSATSDAAQIIQIAKGANKIIHLFRPNELFSSSPEQVSILPRVLERDVENKEIRETIITLENLKAEVWQVVERDVHLLNLDSEGINTAMAGIDLSTRTSSSDSLSRRHLKKRAANESRRWLDLINRGDTTK